MKPRLGLKIDEIKIAAWKKLDHHLVAKIDGKLNQNYSLKAQKRCVLTQLKWYYGEKGLLSAITIQKSEVNFFNLFTRRPNLHRHVSHYHLLGFANSSTFDGLPKKGKHLKMTTITWLQQQNELRNEFETRGLTKMLEILDRPWD